MSIPNILCSYSAFKDVICTWLVHNYDLCLITLYKVIYENKENNKFMPEKLGVPYLDLRLRAIPSSINHKAFGTVSLRKFPILWTFYKVITIAKVISISIKIRKS